MRKLPSWVNISRILLENSVVTAVQEEVLNVVVDDEEISHVDEPWLVVCVVVWSAIIRRCTSLRQLSEKNIEVINQRTRRESGPICPLANHLVWVWLENGMMTFSPPSGGNTHRMDNYPNLQYLEYTSNFVFSQSISFTAENLVKLKNYVKIRISWRFLKRSNVYCSPRET